MFGKKRKFAEAYGDFYPVVFSTIYSKVNSIDDTEDICHDLFVRFYEKIDEIDNYRQWLLAALRLEVFAYYRRRKPDLLDPESLFEDVSLSFVNGFRDTRLVIEEAIEKIEDAHGSRSLVLFELVAIKQFSFHEAGKHLGMTYRQVRYRYGEIMRWLQDYLEKKGVRHMEDLL